jgi:hypothetical protein
VVREALNFAIDAGLSQNENQSAGTGAFCERLQGGGTFCIVPIHKVLDEFGGHIQTDSDSVTKPRHTTIGFRHRVRSSRLGDRSKEKMI